MLLKRPESWNWLSCGAKRLIASSASGPVIGAGVGCCAAWLGAGAGVVACARVVALLRMALVAVVWADDPAAAARISAPQRTARSRCRIRGARLPHEELARRVIGPVDIR